MHSDKSALIVGASRGLGAELAKKLQGMGLRTIEIARSQRPTSISHLTTYLPCDLNDANSTQLCIQDLAEMLPSVDHFFWVAGVLLKGDLVAHSAQEVLSTIDVNLRNPIQIAHAVWQAMAHCSTTKTFTIVASTSGVTPRTDEAVYVATKFAQVGFAKSLGLENKNPNMKVALVLPGGMRTSLWDNHPSPHYDSYLDPKKVADKIVSDVFNIQQSFVEIPIPRGSLV